MAKFTCNKVVCRLTKVDFITCVFLGISINFQKNLGQVLLYLVQDGEQFPNSDVAFAVKMYFGNSSIPSFFFNING